MFRVRSIIVIIALLWVTSLFVISTVISRHYITEIDNQKVVIHSYQEGVTQFQKRLSDSVLVWVAQTHVMKMQRDDLLHTHDSLQRANLALLKQLGVKENKIQSLASFNAVLEKTFQIKLSQAVSDTTEALQAFFEQMYSDIQVFYSSKDSTLSLHLKEEIPIVQAVVKIKYRYKDARWFGGRFWKRIWEKPSLQQTLTSPIPGISFKYPEFIQVE